MLQTAFTTGNASWHDGNTSILEDLLHITEVEVDITFHSNHLSYALGSYRQNIIGFSKCFAHSSNAISINLTQTFIVDYQEGINILLHFLYTFESLHNLSVALEEERDSNDAYGELVHLFGNTSYHRCSTSTCTTTHTSGNKYHLSPVIEEVAYFFNAFFSSFTCHLRVVASS